MTDDIKRQIRHVCDALIAEFEGSIDMADVASKRPEEIQNAFLSRALAAKAVRIVTGCSSSAAAQSVIDGRDDYGVDAVAVSETEPELWLVQAKWSDKYRAGFDTEAANKLVRGFRQMDEQQFERFNARFEPLADQVKEVLADPRSRVTFVIAVMGPGDLSPEVVEILEDADRDFGILGRALSHRVIDGGRFHQAIRDDIAPEAIDLMASMSNGWHRVELPYEAIYGLVAASELAGWYSDHGERLFGRNLRTTLSRTGVNDSLAKSFVGNPQDFWYYHNGITVLCDGIERRFLGKRGIGEPVRLVLSDCSVVNGAQTVASAHAAYVVNADALDDAYVSVRVISIRDSHPGFANAVTMNTNTQNSIEPRDYVALDPTQIAIREDFKLSLGKEYVLRRGELDPSPDGGCSVVEAATALACAHSNPALAVRAKRSTNLLWERGGRGAYELLFGQQPAADEIWRLVLILRRVRNTLSNLRKSLEPRPAAIAERADLLVVHAFLKTVDRSDFDQPFSDPDFDEILLEAEQRSVLLLALLSQSMDRLFGTGSYVSATFSNEERCAELVAALMLALDAGSGAEEAVERIRSGRSSKQARRPNSVALLVDAERIADGAKVAFVFGSEVERQAIRGWMSENPARSIATWVNDRSRPLLWEFDGRQYSPTGLVRQIWELAGWADAWVSVQGPRQWVLSGEDSLADLADRVWREQQEGGGDWRADTTEVD
ncbi:AIPR family protein [Kribbella sp. CA-247076]|uniref:AIPR family protein n=1 Tax=Kribbella sp. CA-247076 TaxID=3239941 RepID=UPI003D8EE28D